MDNQVIMVQQVTMELADQVVQQVLEVWQETQVIKAQVETMDNQVIMVQQVTMELADQVVQQVLEVWQETQVKKEMTGKEAQQVIMELAVPEVQVV
jgi:(2Fe-2S) ferredoxin